MVRSQFIQKYFLNIQLGEDMMEVYVPRKAILAAVQKCGGLLKGEVLDVGCGQMPYRELLLQQNKNITRYIGLDLEVSSVHDTSIADLHWDGHVIPLPDASVSSVIVTEVLEHSFKPTEMLREIHRVMRTGGVLFFTVPFLWPLHEVPHDAYRYTPFSLKAHLEEAGFENIIIQSLGGWYASFAQMLGLWFSQTKLKGETMLRGKKRAMASRIVSRTIRYLLKKDVPDDSFRHHSMMTGLYGTAIKK